MKRTSKNGKSENSAGAANLAAASARASQARAQPWLLGLAAVLFVVTRAYILLVLEPEMTSLHDTYFYKAVEAVDLGLIPYQELEIEYPPLSWWVMCAPRMIDRP